MAWAGCLHRALAPPSRLPSAPPGSVLWPWLTPLMTIFPPLRRAAEAEKARTKNAPKKGGPRSENVGTNRKLANHGQSAQIDSNGHLIWD